MKNSLKFIISIFLSISMVILNIGFLPEKNAYALYAPELGLYMLKVSDKSSANIAEMKNSLESCINELKIIKNNLDKLDAPEYEKIKEKLSQEEKQLSDHLEKTMNISDECGATIYDAFQQLYSSVKSKAEPSKDDLEKSKHITDLLYHSTHTLKVSIFGLSTNINILSHLVDSLLSNEGPQKYLANDEFIQDILGGKEDSVSVYENIYKQSTKTTHPILLKISKIHKYNLDDHKKIKQLYKEVKNFKKVKPPKKNDKIDFDKSLLQITKELSEKRGYKNALSARFKLNSKSMEIADLNESKTVQMDASATSQNSRTMIPVKFASDALGLEVSWDKNTRTVTLKDKNLTVKIPVDTNEIITNGKTLKSDVKPMLKNSRTYLSISNLASAIGLKNGDDIFWNPPTKEVIIIREIK